MSKELFKELDEKSTEKELKEFYNILKKNKPVLLFIKAKWCTPCVSINEVFSSFIEKYQKVFEKYDISIFKLDIDCEKLSDLFLKLNILTIPYIALLDNLNISEDNFLNDFSIIGKVIKEYIPEEEFKTIMGENLKTFMDTKSQT